MELKTDDVKMISREEYIQAVKKIMGLEAAEAAMSAAVAFVHLKREVSEEDRARIKSEVKSTIEDMLKLQAGVLRRMEDELFGKRQEEKKEEKSDV